MPVVVLTEAGGDETMRYATAECTCEWGVTAPAHEIIAKAEAHIRNKHRKGKVSTDNGIWAVEVKR